MATFVCEVTDATVKRKKLTNEKGAVIGYETFVVVSLKAPGDEPDADPLAKALAGMYGKTATASLSLSQGEL